MTPSGLPVDKSPRRIREMFDLIAPRYDFLNRLLSLRSDVRWRRRAAKHAALPGSAPRRMLDVCAGTGDLALELARRWGCDVVAADFSGHMVRLGALKARRQEEPRVHFVQADGRRLPFRGGAFDACAVAFGIRNVADPDAALREMARVVRPGGRVIVLEFTLPPRRVVRGGYRFYFTRILPLVGELLAPVRRGAYRYLPASVDAWPSPEEFRGALQRAGLGQVFFERLTLGVAAIHVGTTASGT